MDVDIFDVVKQGNIEMLQEILTKYKVSVTVTDKDGATPLMYAARKSDTQVIDCNKFIFIFILFYICVLRYVSC